MINRKFALAAAFIFAGTAAFSAISDGTIDRITEYLGKQTYDWAEVRVGPSQIKIEMISDGQKVEVILRTEDFFELKRETEATAWSYDGSAPAPVYMREKRKDFVRLESDDGSVDDDSVDDDEDGDDSDDDSSDDNSDDNSGGSDDSDDDSNDDNGGDRDGSDDRDDSNDDDSNDDSGSDDNGNSGSDDNSSGSDDSDND